MTERKDALRITREPVIFDNTSNTGIEFTGIVAGFDSLKNEQWIQNAASALGT